MSMRSATALVWGIPDESPMRHLIKQGATSFYPCAEEEQHLRTHGWVVRFHAYYGWAGRYKFVLAGHGDCPQLRRYLATSICAIERALACGQSIALLCGYRGVFAVVSIKRCVCDYQGVAGKFLVPHLLVNGSGYA